MTSASPKTSLKLRRLQESLEQQVTERTAQLKESVAHFRLLTENVSDVVWKHDPDGFFTYISPADERLRGFRADEVIGHHVFELMTEESVAAVTEVIRWRQETKAPVGAVTFEAQQRCKDGSFVWTEIISNPEIDANGTVTGHHGITRNITERKRLEETLRINSNNLALTEYASHVVQSIERERTRIARELHDDLGQNLTMLSFAISQLKRDTFGGENTPQTLLDMKSGVNRMMESIRRICTTLRPALLDELGLIPALEQLCADFTKSSGIPCSFDFNGLSTECRAVQHEICSTTIFRIVQESLNNSLKYARASHVAVSLRRNIGVTLEIRDDGCGFMLEAQTGSGSFGITGMRERAGSLGATLDIISTPGKGTRVKLVVPCSCQEKTQCVS